jgi:hypothetical protein
MFNLYFRLETLPFTLLLSPSSFQNARAFLDGASVTNVCLLLLSQPICCLSNMTEIPAKN